jgi:hypothetical protein
VPRRPGPRPGTGLGAEDVELPGARGRAQAPIT